MLAPQQGDEEFARLLLAGLVDDHVIVAGAFELGGRCTADGRGANEVGGGGLQLVEELRLLVDEGFPLAQEIEQRLRTLGRPPRPIPPGSARPACDAAAVSSSGFRPSGMCGRPRSPGHSAPPRSNADQPRVAPRPAIEEPEEAFAVLAIALEFGEALGTLSPEVVEERGMKTIVKELLAGGMQPSWSNPDDRA